MILKNKIPKDFYKLFRTKNHDAYMQLIAAVYEENNEVYTTLGLTQEECCAVIRDTIARARIIWESEDEIQEQEETVEVLAEDSAVGILKKLIQWGWLKSDYDERLNTYVISFPEYSQLFAELFCRLQKEDDSKERESILSIYSALFTYHSDKEKNNEILKNALRTSKGLGQLLSNMQDGMRAYFDELASKKNFIGIQQVLVEELNNSDSKKYAILTTTDSFYRYKEAVKELISQILSANDRKREELLRAGHMLEPGSVAEKRNHYALEYCENTNELVFLVEREFDMIERKYNKLIEQKTVFAKRALARIHYLLREGTEDNLVRLVNLLDRSPKREELLQEMSERMALTVPYKNVTDNSFSGRREHAGNEFVPLVIEQDEGKKEPKMTDFVPKPLYTRQQLQQFCEKNMENGRFVTTEHTIQCVEDLEKLMLLWQEETNERLKEDNICLDGEITGKDGVIFSKLMIDMRKG